MPETATPFTTHRFAVHIRVPGLEREVCDASFSECDGLEMTLETKTIREGGNNGQQIHVIGPVSYGRLTLKRGMTERADLWAWFEKLLETGRQGLRADALVTVLGSDRDGRPRVDARYVLTRCLPVKLKVPSLSAREGGVAIEEMQIAYESLRMKA